MLSLSLKNFSTILGIKGDFSVLENLCLPIKKVYPGNSLREKLILLYALQYFAPEVRLHSQDTERPSSVEFFFSGVHLKYDDNTLQQNNITSQSILGRVRDGISSEASSVTGGTEEWKLEIVERERARVRRGETGNFRNRRVSENVPCYCHAKPVDVDANWYDFQYLFFYPYNSMNVVGFGLHEGDWEHVTVRVDLRDMNSIDDMRIKGVYFSAHETGYWARMAIPENSFNPNTTFFYQKQNGQPIVFSAKDSHASYPFFGTVKREIGDDDVSTVATVVGGIAGGVPGAIIGWLSGGAAEDVLPDDHMDNRGPIWNCRGRLVFVGELNSPTEGQEWIRFSGTWGSIPGPAFQGDGWWAEDERGGPMP